MGQLKIGEWLIDPGKCRLVGDKETRTMEPKVMEVLMVLQEYAGEPVSQETLDDRVWPDTHVSETIVRRAISQLRKVFDDDARKPRYVETVPKKGYRLIAPVIHLHEGSEEVMDHLLAQTIGREYAPVRVGDMATFMRRTLLFVLPLFAFILLIFYGFYFIRNRSSALWNVSNFSGTYVDHVTRETGLETRPAVSPANYWLAFVHKSANDEPSQVLATHNLGKTVQEISPGNQDGMAPSWGPYGKVLAYISGNRILACTVALGGMESGTSEHRALYSGSGALHSIDWISEDTLVFSEKDRPNMPYRLISKQFNQQKQPLTAPPSRYWGDTDPSVSPDGERVAFIRTLAPGHQDVYVIPSAGGQAVRLTFLNRELAGLCWSGDSNEVIFSAYHFGRFVLWRVDTRGGSAQRFLERDDSLRYPVFSPEGDRLFCENRQQHTEIFKLNPSDSTPKPVLLVSAFKWDTVPNYAPDGKRIVFMSTRAGPTELWMVDTNGSNLTQLTSFGGPYTTNPAWAPDSLNIAFESRLEGHGDIYLLDTRGGLYKRLTHNEGEDAHPVWSRDGRAIYFASNREDGWQIWRTTPEGGTAKRITRYGGYKVAQDFDGNSIYYSKYEGDGVWRQSSPEAEPIRILDLPISQWGNWTLATDGIYYVELTPDPRLVFRSFEGETRQVAMLGAAPENPSLTLSRDGQNLIYSRREANKGDLILLKR